MTMRVENLNIGTRLRDVTAAFEPGRITAICGPNGAGKSTLLQALAGLLEADAGAVLLGDKPLVEVATKSRAQAIGYLPQSSEVAWDVPVRNIVALGRMPHGDAKAAPVEAALAALDLRELADRRALTLSGGETARMLLARVLAGEPQWILADEPLAALDLSHQIRLIRQFRAEAARGIGVIVIVHDLAIARNHADHVIVLDKGRLAAEGSAQEALSADIIQSVWGVETHWIGEAGAQALITA